MSSAPYKIYISFSIMFVVLLLGLTTQAFADTEVVNMPQGNFYGLPETYFFKGGLADTNLAVCELAVLYTYPTATDISVISDSTFRFLAPYYYWLSNDWAVEPNNGLMILQVNCDYTLPPPPVFGESVVFATNEEVQKFYTWIWWYIFVFALAVGIPLRFVMRATNSVSSW